jgi:hypothetical protein
MARFERLRPEGQTEERDDADKEFRVARTYGLQEYEENLDPAEAYRRVRERELAARREEAERRARRTVGGTAREMAKGAPRELLRGVAGETLKGAQPLLDIAQEHMGYDVDRPSTEGGLYRAGHRISEFAEDAFPLDPDYEDSRWVSAAGAMGTLGGYAKSLNSADANVGAALSLPDGLVAMSTSPR